MKTYGKTNTSRYAKILWNVKLFFVTTLIAKKNNDLMIMMIKTDMYDDVLKDHDSIHYTAFNLC